MPRINNKGRRNFIKATAKAGFAFTSISLFPDAFISSCSPSRTVSKSIPMKTGFDQTPLPYAYNALEPVIDATTMELHYSKHAATYARNLKEAATVESVDMKKELEDVLNNISKYSAKMRNNAGGHYNHEMFWRCMNSPKGAGQPAGRLASAIETSFNNFESFKTQFNDAAKGRFGSGWAWLVVTADKTLRIGSTANQDNPLMDISDFKGFPVLALDVWEHAYYLKYQNRRPEYIENWWKVINWDYVQERFESI